MKKIVFLALVSTFLMADMGGWSQETEEEKAQKVEQERLCKVYTGKVEDYKKTMRDDELAQATLNNYVRLQTKYCATSENNTTN